MMTPCSMRVSVQSKRTLAKWASASWGLGLCMAWLTCASSSALAAAPAKKPSELAPDEIFQKSCTVCHGDRGNGLGRAAINLDPKPRDFTQASNLTREAMINAVAYGRPGTAMMPWKSRYTEKQIEGVVDYIRGRFMLVALDPHIEAGRGVYGHFCQTCHGDRGQGVKSTETPSDWTTPKAQLGLTRERMISAAARGYHGSTVAAGFRDKLSAENIEASVDYIRKVLIPGLAERDKDQPSPVAQSTQPLDVPPPPAAVTPKSATAQADMKLPMPKHLSGNLEQGRKFFMGNCATCHGPLGNGEGPRAYFLNPRPRNFHDDYSHANLNRPALFEVITNGKPGSVMPAWGKVLSEQEIANVAEFVFQTFIQEKAGAKAN